MPIRPIAIVFLGLAVGWAGYGFADEPETADLYRSTVAPFLKTYCLECHGPNDAQANFRVDRTIPNQFSDAGVRARWAEVVNVLNSHEMPPEDKRQPNPEEVSTVVDWITQETVNAERKLRENVVVMRRLNRNEYRNTIRDLVGIDFDVSGFPQDPPASGFDNIGSSLSLSPMQLEMYLESARQIIDAATVTGEQPPQVRWRFEIDSGDSDSNRVLIDGQNPIVNGGNNPVERGFKRIHHASWDKSLNVRDFAMKHAGTYIVRIRAAGTVPKREQVVQSARKYLERRFNDQMKENPKGEKWHREQLENDLKHFETDWIYNYGPPRLKLVQDLGGQPKTIAEFDVPASLEDPQVYEIPISFTTQRAGVTVEYAYSIPSVLDNFWMQTGEEFARPELWVDWIELEGPVYPAWPPESHANIFPEELTEKNEKELIERWIGKFARRAFRRPVTRSEIAHYVDWYHQRRSQGVLPAEAYKSVLTNILVSPHFLFLVETPESAKSGAGQGGQNAKGPSESSKSTVDGAGQGGAPRITSHQLANRLSYFLWSSQPDSELMAAADARQLNSSHQLDQQVQRMLNDPKSEAFVHNFAGQWLGLREVGANPPATDLYPHYDRHLETSMVEEARATFRTVLKDNRNALDLVHADYVVINERLARFYEIENVRGDEFRTVRLPKNHSRGGLMTQASMLTITSNGTRTSPVKRGTWVLKNILGTDPGLPVANAGDIAPKVPGIDKATVRQRLEIHRELPQCARCHNKIDPLGLALENFDASGRYREQEGFGYKGRVERDDPRIDAGAKLPDGVRVDGPVELKQALRGREELFLTCLAEKMLTYALGRELTLADRPAVRKIVKATQQNQYRLDAMISAIVQSDSFQQY